MESTLKRLERVQDAHKTYSEVIEQQLSIIFREISKITPVKQDSEDKTNENANSTNSDASSRRGAPRKRVITNNHPSSVTNSLRAALPNGIAINDKFKRPNNVNRRIIQSTNISRLAKRSTKKSCTTSRKIQDFSAEPICDKKVDKIPGIGPKAAEKLSALNYVYARRLLGKFLETDKSEFLVFLRTEAGLLPHNAERAWKSLDDYRINHL